MFVRKTTVTLCLPRWVVLDDHQDGETGLVYAAEYLAGTTYVISLRTSTRGFYLFEQSYGAFLLFS